ncbi:winged helix-turn-helix domain-containing protein [Streptomyces sp. NPDC002205]|uniref:winged helix-turn-helix domain-containing protein n=1 Tax=Streptomyces sp. NPDC002205 TaxID=3154411 RepID=UPI00332BB4A3
MLKRHGWCWQAPARRALERDEHVIELGKKETSHTDNESSCFGGELCRWLVGEGLGLVGGGSDLEAVEEHSHEAVEQVPLGGDVAVAGFFAAVVVGSGAR